MKLDDVTPGNPCWVDIMSSDLSRTRAFYTRLLGWDAEEPNPDFGGYFNFTRDGERIAGGGPTMGEGMPDVWSVYLAVEDADATVAAAERAGGSVVAPVMDIADLGRMAVVAGPDGAVVGLWQPGQHRGFAFVAEPGAPGWFELFTRDFATSAAFYTEVFGWDLHVVGDTDEFRYSTLHEGDAAAAGIMDASGFLPDGVPAHWSVYFAVDDTDASVATAVELGASVVQPAEDTPYGRLVSLVDATGAVFKLMGPGAAG